MDGQENLERTWKGREKSENLKINRYSRQSSENLFILFKMGKDVLPRDSQSPSSASLGLLLLETICFLGEQILSFKSSSPKRANSFL